MPENTLPEDNEELVPTADERFNEMMALLRVSEGDSTTASDMEHVLLTNIFGPYPCYAAWSETVGEKTLPMRKTDKDFFFFPTGSGSFTELTNELQAMIEAGSAVVHTTTPLDFEPSIKGYQPKTEIILTQDKTIMRVTETRLRDPENNTFGAPQDMVSLYTWPGGKDFYEQIHSSWKPL